MARLKSIVSILRDIRHDTAHIPIGTRLGKVSRVIFRRCRKTAKVTPKLSCADFLGESANLPGKLKRFLLGLGVPSPATGRRGRPSRHEKPIDVKPLGKYFPT